MIENYPMFKPDCESPILLVNRASLNSIFYGGSLFQAGKHLREFNSRTVFNYPTSYYLSLLDGGAAPDDFVVCNGDFKDYLFFYAPCNSCDLCTSSKQTQFVQRSLIESSLYDVPPFFFTLTYSNRHLPSNRDLCYSDVQKFFKRLRKYWNKLYPSVDFRYIVCGEYGKRTNRAHYHVILFNNPLGATQSNPVLFKRLSDDIFTRWGKCERPGFDISECRGSCAAYVTKYMCKIHSSLRGHRIKPFVHSSCGSGGIGFPHIKSNISFYRSNPSLMYYTFRDYSGVVQNVNFGSYISSKIWPSPSRLVPASVKLLYKEATDIIKQLQSVGVLSHQAAYSLAERFRPYKNVVVNPISMHPKRCKVCPTLRSLLSYRYYVLLVDLYKSLYPYTDAVISPDYISLYRYHKSFIPPFVDHSLGQKKMKKREKIAQSFAKELL